MTTVEPFDPLAATDADAVALHAVRAAAEAVDYPPDRPAGTVAQMRIGLADTRPDRLRFWYVARAGGEVTGYAVLRLPLLDNEHLGTTEVVVRPGSRRQGTGTALLRAVVTTLLDRGRRLLLGYSCAGGAGDGFAAAMDVEQTQLARVSRLDLDRVRWDEVTAAAAGPPGYRLVAYTGPCPDELIDSYARAKNAMNDAPTDGADVAEHVYTADRLRIDEAASAKFGELRVVLAVAGDTGAVAGFTEVLLPTGETSGSQGDTAVVPEHRGRGLGLWVKADMLVRLRAERPDVTTLLTGNSSTNAHMLRINDRLGYRPWTELHSWQADAAALGGRLGLRPRRDVPTG